MHRLIYISKTTRELSEEEIQALADLAVSRNSTLDVTGYLTFSDGDFLQYLEGSRSSVEELWSSIRMDDRHTIKQVWQYDSDGPRYFPDWHMRYLRTDHAEDRLYEVIDRTFTAMRPPLQPEVSQLLEKLIGEVSELTRKE